MNRLQKSIFAVAAVSVLGLTTFGTVLAATPPATPAPGSTYDQRLAQRKQEQNLVLTEADQKRLVERCDTAQTKLRLQQTSSVATTANYTKVYGRIDARLWAITGQLKLANQDTFKLEKDRLEFTAKTAAFRTSVTNYQQTLDDILLINCKADVTGFKALLETARTYYAQLRTQSVDIHGYVVDIVKPQLDSHVTDLQPKTPSGTSN